jgi:hypothetical protein
MNYLTSPAFTLTTSHKKSNPLTMQIFCRWSIKTTLALAPNTIQCPVLTMGKMQDPRLAIRRGQLLIIGSNKRLRPTNIIHKKQANSTLSAYPNINLCQNQIPTQIVAGTILLQNLLDLKLPSIL